MQLTPHHGQDIDVNWLSPTELADVLESGQYKKGRKELVRKDIGGYCCLGVLCMESGIPETLLDTADLTGLNEFFDLVDGMPMWDDDDIENGYLYAHPFIGPEWLTGFLHDELAVLNDRNVGWKKVIEKLRSLDNA